MSGDFPFPHHSPREGEKEGSGVRRGQEQPGPPGQETSGTGATPTNAQSQLGGVPIVGPGLWSASKSPSAHMHMPLHWLRCGARLAHRAFPPWRPTPVAHGVAFGALSDFFLDAPMSRLGATADPGRSKRARWAASASSPLPAPPMWRQSP
jgi:hypothetical protein